jgi:hypothetical protein
MSSSDMGGVVDAPRMPLSRFKVGTVVVVVVVCKGFEGAGT